MRIMFTIGGMTDGGAERVVATLAGYFYSEGHSVTICCIGRSKHDDVDYDIDSGVDTVWINAKHKNTIAAKLRQWHDLRKYIEKSKPDVVVAFMGYIAVQTLIANLFGKTPVVFSLRANHEAMAGGISGLISKALFMTARGAVWQTKDIMSRFKRIRRRRDVLILNPIAKGRADADGTIVKRKQIIAVGRLDRQKNYPLLIESFNLICGSHPEYTLEIFGEGEEYDSIVALIRERRLGERVHINPYSHEIAKRLSESALYVMSSISEGLPNTLIEAMCLGLPCATTDFEGGGAHELIGNMENGVIVSNNDTGALAAVMDLLLRDQELAERLGNNAKKLIERVGVAKVGDEWLALFSDIIVS